MRLTLPHRSLCLAVSRTGMGHWHGCMSWRNGLGQQHSSWPAGPQPSCNTNHMARNLRLRCAPPCVPDFALPHGHRAVLRNGEGSADAVNRIHGSHVAARPRELDRTEIPLSFADHVGKVQGQTLQLLACHAGVGTWIRWSCTELAASSRTHRSRGATQTLSGGVRPEGGIPYTHWELVVG